jgi:hypothetical protein
LQLV